MNQGNTGNKKRRINWDIHSYAIHSNNLLLNETENEQWEYRHRKQSRFLKTKKLEMEKSKW